MRTDRKRIAVVIAAVCMLAAGCQGTSVQQKANGAAESEQQTGSEQQAETEQKNEKEQQAKLGEQAAAERQGAAGKQDAAEEQDAAEKQEPAGQVAGEQETVSQVQVVTADMSPVYGKELKDGVYDVKVDSSSSMFKITECKLIVENGSMHAVMTMSGTGYLKLYMGTGEEAVKAAETDYIFCSETENGACTFQVPVEALDAGIDCSAFSRKKEKWYDRVLVFRADSLPADAFAEEKLVSAESLKLEDGMYTAEVALEGGSGRASVESPAQLRVEDGKVFAAIVWGSANYDYMKVDGEIYEWDGEDEHSTFEIPVAGFDWKIPVIADTIAMSVPHEIEYTLTFDSESLKRAE